MLFNKYRLFTIGAVIVALIVTVALPVQVLAHNKVVVIPMSGDDLQPLQNIITVAKKNGDFTDPVTAMASITDATFENPYLVIIAPGQYNLTRQLFVKRYVALAGSGKDITQIRGSVSHTVSNELAALVALGNATGGISDITIVNNSGRVNNFSMGLWADCCADVDNVDVFVSDGINQIGIGGTSSKIMNSEISVSGGLLSNTGTDNAFRITNSSIRVDGTNSVGVDLARFNGLTMDNVSLSSSDIAVDMSDISNSGSSFIAVKINSSTVTGSIVNPNSRAIFCNFVFAIRNVALNSTCQ